MKNEENAVSQWLAAFLLQKQIYYQCQQSSILIFLTVSRHQQQKQHHQKILNIEIFWQSLFQKAGNTGVTLPVYLPLVYGPAGWGVVYAA